MSRQGIEPKPSWQSIPLSVRAAVDDALGAHVRRAARIWGGYTPTPTFRLLLDDGRRAFFKAVGLNDNDFAHAAFVREERIYRDLNGLIAPWAPRCYGAVQDGPWSVLLLEDLGPKSVPPWTAGLARRIAGAYGDFHRATMGAAFPEWLPQSAVYLRDYVQRWERMVTDDTLPQLAALAGARADEAHRWLMEALPPLSHASRQLVETAPPYALLHGDIRSDNLRWLNGQLRLFDWPGAQAGPIEYDLSELAQSVTAEGGPEPERIVAWYAERATVRAEVLDAAVAALAGFFADAAWQSEIPGLPRLRSFQRAQLRVMLRWAARRFALPPPTWLDAVSV